MCSAVFETSPSPLAVSLGSEKRDYINDIFIIRKNCSDGVSILQSVLDRGILGQNASLSYQANQQINSVNFSNIATGFSIDDQINLSAQPANQLKVLTSLDLSNFNTTQLDILKNTTLPTLHTQLVLIKSSLIFLNSTITSESLTYKFLLPQNTSPQLNASVSDMQSRITSVCSIITQMTQNDTGTIPNLILQVGYMISNITFIKSEAVNLINTANTIPNYYNSSFTSLRYFANNATRNVRIINLTE